MGRDFNIVDGATGETVVTVRHLWPEDAVDCCMCGKPTFDHFAVAFYERPVRSGHSEGCHRAACGPCYTRWAAWDDAMTEYESWLTPANSSPSQGGEHG